MAHSKLSVYFALSAYLKSKPTDDSSESDSDCKQPVKKHLHFNQKWFKSSSWLEYKNCEMFLKREIIPKDVRILEVLHLNAMKNVSHT